METTLQFLKDHPEAAYLVTFILLSYMVKKSFGAKLSAITRIKWQPVYTVLTIATVLAVPFIAFTEATWQEILLAYALGTSLYEVILEKIINLVKSK